MTYQETLDWMFVQLPMYQQKGKSALNAKLDTIQALSSHLNHPENKFKSIHVAGTNGKGSSSHMLASVLQEAGYKVGLYTSPHLKDFRERIRINGRLIGKRFVINFIKKNKIFFDAYKFSFFEMTVGMAFDYFAKERVDIAIVEVGLGGRLDSTNIIIPEVSLITNIGYDHIEFLGDTIAKIAYEKAGIIKEGVPVVISEFQKETVDVFRAVARERNSKIVFASDSVSAKYKTKLLGNYQNKNIKGVIATLRELKGFVVNEGHIVDGLNKVVQNTGLLGRWQLLHTNPLVVCDTAHNSEGLALVMDQIKEQEYDTLRLVVGFVKDKNLSTILPLFPTDAVYYFVKPNIERGLDAAVLKERAKDYGLQGRVYTTVSKGYKAAFSDALAGDFIYVGGSTFVVAEVV